MPTNPNPQQPKQPKQPPQPAPVTPRYPPTRVPSARPTRPVPPGGVTPRYRQTRTPSNAPTPKPSKFTTLYERYGINVKNVPRTERRTPPSPTAYNFRLNESGKFTVTPKGGGQAQEYDPGQFGQDWNIRTREDGRREAVIVTGAKPLKQLPDYLKQGQQFGLPPGDPNKTIRGQLAQTIAGSPLLQGVGNFFAEVEKIPVLGAGVRLLGAGVDLVERIAGTSAQLLGSAAGEVEYSILGRSNALQEYGRLGEFDLWNAWLASGVTFESTPWSIGTSAYSTPGYLPGFQDPDAMFVDYDLPFVKGGMTTITEARKRLAAGEDYDSVWRDITSRFGAPGQVRELLAGIAADPLNLTAPLGRGALRVIGRVAKDELLLKAVANVTPSFAEGNRFVKSARAFKSAIDSAREFRPLGVAKGLLGTGGRLVFGGDQGGGIVEALHEYRNLLVAQKLVRPGVEAANDLSRLQKLLIGKRMLQLADTGTYTRPRGILSLFKVTPESEARELVTQASNLLQPRLTQAIDESLPLAENADRMAAIGEALAKADPARVPAGVGNADVLARISNTIEGRITRRGLAPEKLSDIAQAVKMSQNEQAALAEIARALDDNNLTRSLGRLGLDADAISGAKSGAARVLDEYRTRTGQALMYAGREATEADLKGIFTVFKDKEIPYTLDHLKGAMLESQLTHMAHWAGKTFGLAPDNRWLNKLSGAVKSTQSSVLLGMNPAYVINNLINGEVTMAVDGAWGLRRLADIQEDLAKYGVAPARLAEGALAGEALEEARRAGQSALAAIDENHPMAWGSAAMQEARAVIDEKLETTGALAEWRKTAARFAGKMPTLKAGQMVEQSQSARSFYSGFKQYFSQNWKVGRGFKKMPAALESALREIDPRLPETIYAATASGYSPTDIAAKIFDKAPRPVAQMHYERVAARLGIGSDDVARLLAEDGLDSRLNDALAKLPENPQPGHVRKMFAEMRDEARASHNKRIALENAERAKHAGEIAKAGDAGKLLELHDEIEMRRFETFQTHMENLRRSWDEVGRIPKKNRALRDLAFRVMDREADEQWARYFDFEELMYSSMDDGLRQSGMILDDGWAEATRLRREATQRFFQQKRSNLRTFFDLPDEARTEERWAAVLDDNGRLYTQLSDEQNIIQTRVDEYIAAQYARQFGEETGNLIRDWRGELRELTRRDMQDVMGYRQAVRDRATSTSWEEFNKQRLTRLAERERLALAARRVVSERIPMVEVGAVTPFPTIAEGGGVPADLARLKSRRPFVAAETPSSAPAVAVAGEGVGAARPVAAIPEAPGPVSIWATPEGERIMASRPLYESRLIRRVAAGPFTPGRITNAQLLERGWTTGRKGLLSAINEHRAARGLEPLKRLAEADPGVALLAMNTRLSQVVSPAIANDVADVVRREMDVQRATQDLRGIARPAGEIIQTPRDQVLEMMRPFVAGAPDEVDQLDDLIRIADARAEIWAKQTGRSIDDYFNRFTTEAGAGEALYQAAPGFRVGDAVTVQVGGVMRGARGVVERALDADSGRYVVRLFDGSSVVTGGRAMGARGSVTFLDDGRAVMRAMEAPDVSTAVHELGHVFRRDLEDAALSAGPGASQAAEDLIVSAEWAGAERLAEGGHLWTLEAEETFARGFERYLADGIAPTPALERVFERFKNWLANLYQRLRGSTIDPDIPDAMRGVYERLLAGSPELAGDVALDPSRLFRHDLPSNLSQNVEYLARQMYDEITGGAPGGRIFEEGQVIGGYGSSYPAWYGAFLNRYGAKKETVLNGLQKIIRDHGEDQGLTIERLKQVILEQLSDGMETPAGKMPADPEALRLLDRPREEVEAAYQAWQSAGMPISREVQPSAPATFYQNESGAMVVRTSMGDVTVQGLDDTKVTVLDANGQTQEISILARGEPLMPPGATDELGMSPMPVAEAMADTYDSRLLPILDELQKSMEEGVTLGPVKGAQNLAPDMQQALRSWHDETIGEMPAMKNMATKYGEFKRDAALLNYSRRYGYNTYLGWVAPYEFWATQSMIKWALRTLDRPAVLASYYRAQKFLNTQVTREGLPSRMTGKIRIKAPFLPDWMGDEIFIDPLRVMFPFQNWIAPWERYMQSESRIEQKTVRELQDMRDRGEVTDEEYNGAFQSKSGSVWDQARQSVVAQDENLEMDGVDLGTSLFAPSMPLKWALDALRGKKPDVSPLPPTRYIRALSTMLGIGGPGGVNLEESLRRSLGLPILDEWADYRIDRELANMAAEGLITADEARIAMLEKSGPIYEKAQLREAQQSALGTLFGSPFGTWQFFPEGERRQRALQPLYNAAWQAENNGDTEALTRFFDEYPEYKARLALNAKPEDRMRNFLTDKMWGWWMDAPTVYHTQLQQALGPEFDFYFLDKETRDIDAIPIEQLQRWAATIGQTVPGDPETARPYPIEWAPPEVVMQVENYYQQRESLFDYDRVSALQSEYFTIPEDKRVALGTPRAVLGFMAARDQQFPGITQTIEQYSNLYGKQKSAFRRAHPELGAFYDLRDAWKSANPQVAKMIASNGDAKSRTDSARDIFVNRNPELKAYWDWRRGYLEQYPAVQAYLDEQKRFYEEQGPDYGQYAMSFSPEVNRIATTYLFAGRPMSGDSRKRLKDEWEEQGKPGGSLEMWLMSMVAVQAGSQSGELPASSPVVRSPGGAFVPSSTTRRKQATMGNTNDETAARTQRIESLLGEIFPGQR